MKQLFLLSLVQEPRPCAGDFLSSRDVCSGISFLRGLGFNSISMHFCVRNCHAAFSQFKPSKDFSLTGV